MEVGIVVERIAVNTTRLYTCRTTSPPVGQPISETAGRGHLEQRHRHLTGEPACKLAWIADQTAPSGMRESHPCAIIDRLKLYLNLCQLLGTPVGLMPLQQDHL